MKTGSVAWGFFIIFALIFGAAFFLVPEELRREQQDAIEMAREAFESRLEAQVLPRSQSSPPASVEVGFGEAGPAEAESRSFPSPGTVTFGKPPRADHVHIDYGRSYRRRGPLDGSDEWFPFVAAALVALFAIGYVRIRVDRARG
jgi:hypothetical protein